MATPFKMCCTIASALAMTFIATILVAQSPANDWLESPEAMFMTNAERQEWWTLHTEIERDSFKQRYYARRDPTPLTQKNEFQEMLEQRIDQADKRFTLDRKTRGALTYRGEVYVLLGPPARVSSLQSSQGQVQSPGGSVALVPGIGIGRGAVEGNEVTEKWFYERTRTPKILAALGRPSLDFTFVVEPVKQKDDLQNPGLFNELRETVAEKTILNDIPAVPGAPVAPSAALPAPSAAASAPGPTPIAPPMVLDITPEISSALDRAAESGSQLRSNVLWTGSTPSVMFWLVAPEGAYANEPLALYGRVKDKGGKVVAKVARVVNASKTFSSPRGGAVGDAEVALGPGEYDAAFILAAPPGNAEIAAGTAHVIVPELQSRLAVSSLVLTDRVDGAGDGVSLGPAHVRPRADATFTTAESMWYLFQVANPSDPSKVTVAIRLRHGTAPPSSPTVLPAGLQSVGASNYMSGFELPLRELSPGEYTLYVSVHDPGVGDDVVRRADFRVVEAPRLQ